MGAGAVAGADTLPLLAVGPNPDSTGAEKMFPKPNLNSPSGMSFNIHNKGGGKKDTYIYVIQECNWKTIFQI